MFNKLKVLTSILFVAGTTFLNSCSISFNQSIASESIDDVSSVIQSDTSDDIVCSHSNIVIDEEVLPTCTKHGLSEGSHCGDCGEIIKPQDIIESLGHQFVLDDPIESTCSKEGKSVGLHCSRCGEILIEQECIEKKPHTKGKLIDLTIGSIENVYNPAIFECDICHEHYYDSISFEDISFPIMSITGNLSSISKENKVKVECDYHDSNQSFDLSATLNLQGASSIYYPKKNYNIQFYKDDTFAKKQKVQLVESWGSQSKYTLKANYIDFSQLRNVISAKIYGDIVHSRNIDDNFDKLVNGGAIDGYPIIVYQNGAYQGLYTLNMSKDSYLFGMDGDDSSRQAILMANQWSETVALREHVPNDFGDYWELEYSSTEDNQDIGNQWVADSFNEMMDFVNNNDGEAFVEGISHYINVPRAIDSMLYTWAMKATDNSSKNILWVTYDGVQWMPSVYDMDGTWGLLWDGSVSVSPEAWICDTGNALWEKLYSNMHAEIISRWQELRVGPLNIANVDKHVIDFYNLIPGYLFNTERDKWDMPSEYNNHATQVINWAIESMQNIDSSFGVIIDNEYGYKINFICDDSIKVYAYIDSDYSKDPYLTDTSFSRNGDTGYLTSTNGQLNFKVVLADGYEIDSILIDGNYKNLKGPTDVGLPDTYRITKIASDLTVTINKKNIDS